MAPQNSHSPVDSLHVLEYPHFGSLLQHGSSWIPQCRHFPLAQVVESAVQLSPAQHGSFSPPQCRQR
jgi:hypothetical protein